MRALLERKYLISVRFRDCAFPRAFPLALRGFSMLYGSGSDTDILRSKEGNERECADVLT